MGCPSAAIVMEELVQLGVKRFVRVGTCGGLQPDMQLGDVIVALSAVPADRTVDTYVDHEPHCPTASWELIHGAVHAAKEIGQAMRVGPIVSSDVFYNPDVGPVRTLVSTAACSPSRWRRPCCSRIGALRDVHAAALLTVSDVVVEGEFKRITDDELQAAVDRITRVALATATADSLTTVFLVNPASDNGATGRRWPQLANAAASRGLSGDTLFSERPGHLTELARDAAGRRAPSCSSSSAGTDP